MPGLSDFSATAVLNWATGQKAAPTVTVGSTACPPAQYLGLFTAVGTDAGTGFTEVSGGAYARVQVAGAAQVNGTTANGNPTLHFASTPTWIVAGMTVYDATSPTVIPAATTVLSTTGTTVTMSNNATGAGVGASDSIVFSAFAAPAGGEPQTVTNGAVITFPQATANWGTVIAFGLYDAVSSGNLYTWDYLGNFSWLPAYITSASPGVWDVKGHTYAANDSIIYSNEYGGTLMTMSAGSFSLTGDGSTGVSPILAVQSPSGDTFNAQNGVTTINTSSTGSGMVRKIIQQSIPINVTASFAASSLTITAA